MRKGQVCNGGSENSFSLAIIGYLLLLCRMYCSRRLRRIRKSLHFVQGHRNRFQKRPVTVEKITDARYGKVISHKLVNALREVEVNWLRIGH